MKAPRLRALADPDPDRTDAELVEASIDGDRRAMEALFRRHARKCFGLAFRIMGREDDIEDIVQDAFVEGFERLSKLEDPGAFGSWIATIVVRQAYRRIRRRRLLARLGILADGKVDADEIASGIPSPERALELRGIYAAFDEMSADMRVAIVLHRIERLSLDETSAAMGVSIATVKRRIAEGEAIVRARVGGPAR